MSKHHNHQESRSGLSKLLRYFLDPVFYYLNLYDHGKPSLSRIMLLGAFIHGLCTLTFVTVHELAPIQQGQAHASISTIYLLFAGLVYSITFGYRGFHMYVDSKFMQQAGGQLGQIEEARAQEISAELQAHIDRGGVKAPTYYE